jgi:hypothetical protein
MVQTSFHGIKAPFEFKMHLFYQYVALPGLVLASTLMAAASAHLYFSTQ